MEPCASPQQDLATQASAAQNRTTFLGSFSRSQVSSLVATAVDFGTLVFLVEVLGLWYVASTALGAFVGAVTNFLLGRHWSFRAADGGLDGQALRYTFISGLSLGLNTLGVFTLTDFIGFKYTVSKVIVAAMVGVFFNFPLHRQFVFRE